MNPEFNIPAELIVTRNSSENRFEVTIGGRLAKVDYRTSGNRMIITHTEVPDVLRGKGVAEQLVAFVVRYARKEGLEVVAECGKPGSQSLVTASVPGRIPAASDISQLPRGAIVGFESANRGIRCLNSRRPFGDCSYLKHFLFALLNFECPSLKMNVLDRSLPVTHSRLKAPIRLGYVGCGFMAQRVHLPNFSTLPQCALLAIAERRSQLAQAVANRFAVEKVYSSHLELAADAEIDAVAVSANYAQQGEIAVDLLKAGKHVFMEKPMAVSVSQGEKILNAAKEGHARLMVAFMKRFDPGNVLAKTTICQWRRDGTKGRLLYARNHGFQGSWLNGLSQAEPFTNSDEPIEAFDAARLLPSWLPNNETKKYLAYVQQYSHNLNLLRFILQADQQTKTRVETVSLDMDGITGLTVLHLCGIRSTLETATSKFHAWDEQTQIYFEGGWIRLAAPRFFAKSEFSALEIYEATPFPRYSYPVVSSEHEWNYRAEAAHFLTSLETGQPFISSGEDALIDVWLSEQIYKKYLGIT